MILKAFPIAPASWHALLPLLLPLFIVAGVLAPMIYSVKNARAEITPEGLRISGTIYRKYIPKEEIKEDEIKILNLNIEKEYRPKARTNGISLPGCKQGWFKLENGEKALLFVTDYSKVIYIPTKKNFSLLLSVENPEEFIALLKT